VLASCGLHPQVEVDWCVKFRLVIYNFCDLSCLKILCLIVLIVDFLGISSCINQPSASLVSPRIRWHVRPIQAIIAVDLFKDFGKGFKLLGLPGIHIYIYDIFTEHTCIYMYTLYICIYIVYIYIYTSLHLLHQLGCQICQWPFGRSQNFKAGRFLQDASPCHYSKTDGYGMEVPINQKSAWNKSRTTGMEKKGQRPTRRFWHDVTQRNKKSRQVCKHQGQRGGIDYQSSAESLDVDDGGVTLWLHLGVWLIFRNI